MALITPADVKDAGDIQNTDRDLRIQTLIDAVWADAERYCLRDFDYGTHTEHFTLDKAVGYVFVKAPPIESITSVTDDIQYSARAITVADNVVNEQEYFDRGEVRLYKSEGLFTADPTEPTVTVVYVGGYTQASLPANLREALCQEVLFRLRGRVVGVESQSADGASVKYSTRDGFAIETADFLDATYKLHHRGIV